MRRGLAAVAVALVVVACSDGDDLPALRATPVTTSSTTTTAAATTTTPAATTPGAATTTARPPAPGRPPAACPTTPARVAPSADRPEYTLDVDVRLAENAVEGDVAVRFTPDRPIDELVFRLWPNGPRPAGAGGHLATGPVTVDGRPAEPALASPTILTVPLGTTVAAGRTIDARMPWRLTLPDTVNDRVSRDGDAVRLGSFFPILAWEPGVGWAHEPPTGAFAEAAESQVADFDVAVTVPDGFTVLASGTPGGAGRWKADAVRDFALSVGRFTIVTGTAGAPGPVAVTVGVHAGLSDSAAAYLAKIERVLAAHASRFGPYPWSTLTVAITPGLSGGIEYPTHIMQGPGTLGRTTSHELAHMWFYSLVGNNQGRDPWIDEGLATYAEARAEGSLASFRGESIPAGARGRAGEPMTYWEPRQSIYYRGVYVQGAQAIAALGPPDLVDCALRILAARQAYRVARPADVIAAATEVFPDAAAVMAPFGIHG